MALLRQNLIPTLIILVAGLLVSLAALPLGNTEFAAGIRRSSTTASADFQSLEGEAAPIGGILVLLPLVKVAALMGVGAGLTALVLWILHKGRGIAAAQNKVPAKSNNPIKQRPL